MPAILRRKLLEGQMSLAVAWKGSRKRLFQGLGLDPQRRRRLAKLPPASAAPLPAPRTEAIVVLLEAGASVEPRTDGEGNTCLHFAASRCQIEACRLLVTAGADPRMTNSFGQTPWMLVPRVKIGSRRLENGDPETFGSGLSDRYRQLRHILDDRRLPPDPSVGHDPMLPRRTAYQVTAAPTPGLHLHNLFPEVEKDDTPSPRVLLSVSALVVSRAAGSLARRVLARQDTRDAWGAHLAQIALALNCRSCNRLACPRAFRTTPERRPGGVRAEPQRNPSGIPAAPQRAGVGVGPFRGDGGQCAGPACGDRCSSAPSRRPPPFGDSDRSIGSQAASRAEKVRSTRRSCVCLGRRARG